MKELIETNRTSKEIVGELTEGRVDFFETGSTLFLDHPKTGELEVKIKNIKYSPLENGFLVDMSIKSKESGETHDSTMGSRQLERDIFPHVTRTKN